MRETALFGPGLVVYHVRNCTVARLPMFQQQTGDDAFMRTSAVPQDWRPTRILTDRLMHEPRALRCFVEIGRRVVKRSE